MVARLLAAILFAASASAAATPVSSALEPGVHADPGSPAAKEYALPLSQARQTGSGHGGGGLFGAGIGRPAHGDASARGRHGAAPRAGGKTAEVRTSGHAPAHTGQSGALPAAVRSASRAHASGGGGSVLALLGGGVAVLALGVLGGSVLRGRRSAAST